LLINKEYLVGYFKDVIKLNITQNAALVK